MLSLTSQLCGDSLLAVCSSRQDGAIHRPPGHSWMSDRLKKEASEKQTVKLLARVVYCYIRQVVVKSEHCTFWQIWSQLLNSLWMCFICVFKSKLLYYNMLTNNLWYIYTYVATYICNWMIFNHMYIIHKHTYVATYQYKYVWYLCMYKS